MNKHMSGETLYAIKNIFTDVLFDHDVSDSAGQELLKNKTIIRELLLGIVVSGEVKLDQENMRIVHKSGFIQL